jgi:hypothetical protein
LRKSPNSLRRHPSATHLGRPTRPSISVTEPSIGLRPHLTGAESARASRLESDAELKGDWLGPTG